MPLGQGNRLLLGGRPGGVTLKHLLMRHLVRGGMREGRLQRGGVVAELSAGASAVALAQVAREEGLHALLFVPTTLEPELMEALHRLDAEVVASPPSLDSIRDALARLLAMHESGAAYWTRQNYNPLARTAYEPLARAVLAQEKTPEVLVAGIGTGGVLHAFGRVLRRANRNLRVIGIHSTDISGLRGPDARFDLADLGLDSGFAARDLGARDRLLEQLGPAVSLVTRERDRVREARASLGALGVRCGDSTGAVVQVIQELGLQNALGVSIDGRFDGG